MDVVIVIVLHNTYCCFLGFCLLGSGSVSIELIVDLELLPWQLPLTGHRHNELTTLNACVLFWKSFTVGLS